MAWAQLLKGVAVEAHLEQVLHVEAHRLHVEVEQVDRVVQQKDDQHEEHPGGKADLGDAPNSVTDAREDGAGCNSSDGPDDDKLGGRRDGNSRLEIELLKPFLPRVIHSATFFAEHQNIFFVKYLEKVKPTVDLHRAKAKARADSKESGNYTAGKVVTDCLTLIGFEGLCTLQRESLSHCITFYTLMGKEEGQEWCEMVGRVNILVRST